MQKYLSDQNCPHEYLEMKTLFFIRNLLTLGAVTH